MGEGAFLRALAERRHYASAQRHRLSATRPVGWSKHLICQLGTESPVQRWWANFFTGGATMCSEVRSWSSSRLVGCLGEPPHRKIYILWDM